jgi:hypothetical protein
MPQWSPDEARRWSTKGHQSQSERVKRLAAREKLLDKLISQAAEQVATPIANPANGNPDIYLISRLAQVRAQLAALSLRMDEACAAPKVDAKALFALSGSYRQVQEMEQTLSGRPNPGSLRPQAPRRQAAPFTPPIEG